MKRGKVAVGLIVALCLFVALPIGASAGASSSFVQVRGPHKLKVSKQIKFQVVCAVACKVSATIKLHWPPRFVLVDTAKATFTVGGIKVDRLSLSNEARNWLKTDYKRSRLDVIIRAKNLETKRNRTIRKTFHFKL